MKIASVVGARPEFIQASVVSKALRAAAFAEVWIHTGQHYDHCMSDAFFQELDIPEPDYNLEVGSGPQGEQTGHMLARLERVLLDEEPAMVVVYGDTNSTLAGALAACKLGIVVAHSEAGLRSFNRGMPEELNRIVIDHLATLLFAPTETAVENLRAEGIIEGVYTNGDVMYDAILAIRDPAGQRAARLCQELGVEPRGYVLATVHRAGNTDDRARLEGIVRGLGAARMPVLFPVHPRTRRAIEQHALAIPENVRVIEPLSHMDTIALEMQTAVVATDSGGMQKEAYWLGVPCVTLRDETEWVETVEAGWNVLVGADPSVIADALATFRPDGRREDVFGDGRAGAKMARRIRWWLQKHRGVKRPPADGTET